jgi:hypothetical protein
MKLPAGYKPTSLGLEFRVPDLNRDGLTGDTGGETLS